MIATMRLLLPVVLALALTGCPDDPPSDGGDPTPSPTASPIDGGGADGGADGGDEPAGDPLEGSVFDKEALFQIYRADVKASEEERLKVLREHRLLDASGEENPARVQAYERALQQYARNDPEGWAAFVESLAE